MRKKFATLCLLLVFAVLPDYSQDQDQDEARSDDWERTREMLNCTPKLVDRQDLVEDNFEHRRIGTRYYDYAKEPKS